MASNTHLNTEMTTTLMMEMDETHPEPLKKTLCEGEVPELLEILELHED